MISAWGEILVNLLPAFIRAWGMMIILPLSEAGVGIGRKGVFALGLAALTFGQGGAVEPLSGFVLLRELLCGVLLGLPCACLVTLAGMWGELFDSARGQSISTIYDPLHDTQEPLTAVLMRQLCWVQLLCCGFTQQLVGQYRKSYLFLDGAVTGDELSRRMLWLLVQGMEQMFLLFIPFALLFMVVELAVGFIGRAVTGVSFSSEALQIKSCIGAMLLLLMYNSGLVESLLDIVGKPAGLFRIAM